MIIRRIGLSSNCAAERLCSSGSRIFCTAEDMLLAFMGGLSGALAAGWGVELLRQLQPPAGIPLVFDFTLDPGVLAFAFMADHIPKNGLTKAGGAIDKLATEVAGCGCR